MPFLTGSPPGGAVGHVDVGALGDQQLHGLKIAVLSGIRQRRETGNVCRVDVCACVNQLPNAAGVVSHRRRSEDRHVSLVHSFRIRTACEQEANDLRRAVAHRGELECRVSQTRRDLHVGATVHEQADLRKVGCGPHERRRAGGILRVDVGALIKKEPHRVQRTDRRRVHQWRRAAASLFGVDVAPLLNGRRQLCEIAAANRRIERVGRAWRGRLR